MTEIERCEGCGTAGTKARPIIPNRGRRLCGACSWAEIEDQGVDILVTPAEGAIPRVVNVGRRADRDLITPRSR